MTPLLEPLTFATPQLKVMVVVEPKLVAPPVLLVTVGCVLLGVLVAPVKVRRLLHFFPTRRSSDLSKAVTVKLSAAPAVGVVEVAARVRLAARAGATASDRPSRVEMVPSLTTMDAVSAL